MNIDFATKFLRHKLIYNPKYFGVQYLYVVFWLVFTILLCNTSCYAALAGIQVYNVQHPYHKQPSLHNPQLKNDLWHVISSNFSLQHYSNNPDIRKQIQLFTQDPRSLVRITARSTPYLYFIYQQVQSHQLPAELVLIPVIESGYNPFNLSSSGAAGIWQMMPGTASGFGIKQDWWYDGRKDIVASTKAALDYLEYLFDFFDGNYLLAIAAYNSGEGAVMNAIKRNVKSGKSTNFWLLPLSSETKVYVQRFLALTTIIAKPENYQISLPQVSNAPYLAQVDVGSQIDLHSAAKFAQLTLKQLLHLNPGFTHLVTHPHGPYKLVIPIEKVERFMTHLSNNTKIRQINWIQYKIKNHDTLAKIALKFNTTVEIIKKINHLTDNKCQTGKSLVIPQNKSHKPELSLPNHFLKKTNPTIVNTMKPGDTLYVVREQDSIASIAQKFHLSAKIIYQTNNLAQNVILKSGAHLLLPTHLLEPLRYNSANLTNKIIAPGNTLYMIRAGDTLSKISQKFHTTISLLRIANFITNERLIPGAYIIIPT